MSREGEGLLDAEDIAALAREESARPVEELSKAYPKLREALAAYRCVLLDKEGVLWAFRGRNRDYIIVKGVYCSCKDFLVRSVGRGRRKPCYHIVAVERASREGSYVDLSGITSTQVRIVVLEVLTRGFSSYLRRVLSGDRKLEG